MQAKNLIYDGTFDGFLSAVFYVFEHKLKMVTIQNEFTVQHRLFLENETIHTDELKANRVWKGIKSRLSSNGSYQLYYAFLSEDSGVEDSLLEYIQYVFSQRKKVDKDYTHPSILKIAQIALNNIDHSSS